MLSRKERVKLVRDRVSKEWTDKWRSFMMEHESKLDWYGISSNPNLTIEFINENLDKPWDWFYISANPNITMKYIKENPDKPWDWDGISRNPFTRDKQESQLQLYRRHLACYRIQQHWHRIRSDPYHPVGRKKLEREYEREFGFS